MISSLSIRQIRPCIFSPPVVSRPFRWPIDHEMYDVDDVVYKSLLVLLNMTIRASWSNLSGGNPFGIPVARVGLWEIHHLMLA